MRRRSRRSWESSECGVVVMVVVAGGGWAAGRQCVRALGAGVVFSLTCWQCGTGFLVQT